MALFTFVRVSGARLCERAVRRSRSSGVRCPRPSQLYSTSLITAPPPLPPLVALYPRSYWRYNHRDGLTTILVVEITIHGYVVTYSYANYIFACL